MQTPTVILPLRLVLHLQLQFKLILSVIGHCWGLYKPNSHSILALLPIQPNSNTVPAGLYFKWILFWPLVNSDISYWNAASSYHKTTTKARRRALIELWDRHFNMYPAKRTTSSELIFIGPDKSQFE